MTLGYEKRATLCTNPTAKKLFSLMAAKATNLAVAADVTSATQLLKLARLLGPEICVLKTHIDILEGFTPELINELLLIAKEQRFLLFEDRKFADIGNTVKLQYERGIYHIAKWADIVNAHCIPGPGIIAGLQSVGLPFGRGLLLLAQMSSKGNLATSEYTQQAIVMAKQYSDFVIGFITTKKLDDDPRFINFTPGVHIAETNDNLSQQYISPIQAITKNQTDVIIVGRGIYEATDPLAAAKKYRKLAWEAYLSTLLSRD